MLPLATDNSPDKRQLLRVFNGLSNADKQAVQAFAEFLAQRAEASEPFVNKADSQSVPVPLNIPRPEKESVVAAMRRLSNSYAMLNKDELLHKASGLMSEHILQGKSAVAVIDQLERLFADNYAKQFKQG